MLLRAARVAAWLAGRSEIVPRICTPCSSRSSRTGSSSPRSTRCVDPRSRGSSRRGSWRRSRRRERGSREAFASSTPDAPIRDRGAAHGEDPGGGRVAVNGEAASVRILDSGCAGPGSWRGSRRGSWRRSRCREREPRGGRAPGSDRDRLPARPPRARHPSGHASGHGERGRPRTPVPRSAARRPRPAPAGSAGEHPRPAPAMGWCGATASGPRCGVRDRGSLGLARVPGPGRPARNSGRPHRGAGVLRWPRRRCIRIHRLRRARARGVRPASDAGIRRVSRHRRPPARIHSGRVRIGGSAGGAADDWRAAVAGLPGLGFPFPPRPARSAARGARPASARAGGARGQRRIRPRARVRARAGVGSGDRGGAHAVDAPRPAAAGCGCGRNGAGRRWPGASRRTGSSRSGSPIASRPIGSTPGSTADPLHDRA